MLFTFEERPSDSPFVERIWRAHSGLGHNEVSGFWEEILPPSLPLDLLHDHVPHIGSIASPAYLLRDGLNARVPVGMCSVDLLSFKEDASRGSQSVTETEA